MTQYSSGTSSSYLPKARVSWNSCLYIENLKPAKESEVSPSFPFLCGPKDYSLPGSSIPGNFQARILECVAISFSRGSSQSRDRTWVSCIVGRLLNAYATREALPLSIPLFMPYPLALFVYLGCTVFIAAHRLSLVVVRWGSSSQCCTDSSSC